MPRTRKETTQKGQHIKALTIRQPWALLITCGRKTIETRTWPTKYRGPLLICSSASPTGPFSGQALCIAQLVDCRPMTKADATAACCDLYAGAWSWVLDRIVPIHPFRVKGQLRLFDVPIDPTALLCSGCSTSATIGVFIVDDQPIP